MNQASAPMPGFMLYPRKRLELIQRMLTLLAEGTQLSLEGKLDRVRDELGAVPGASHQENAVLYRNTNAPYYDKGFVILPVEPDTVERICRRILPRVGVSHNVWHILIAKDGELQFFAYDNFGEDQVWVRAGVPEEFLQSLVRDQVIKDYKRL